MFFCYSSTPPHPTAKPSWGWLRVGVRKLRLVLFELHRTGNKVTAKAACGVWGCNPPHGLKLKGNPRRCFGFSLITFVPRSLHGEKRAGAFRPTTRSRPRLGLVVRCGDLALSQKNMPFCAFFHVQPKYQNGAIFVHIEGLRSCLSKPSYGAPKWALMVRLNRAFW